MTRTQGRNKQTVKSVDSLIKGCLVRTVDEAVTTLYEDTGNRQAMVCEHLLKYRFCHLFIQVAQIYPVHVNEFETAYMQHKINLIRNKNKTITRLQTKNTYHPD